MHIIAIGWLWVVLMMALTERSVVGGVLTFVFFGLLPCALLIWLFTGGARRRAAARAAQAALLVADEQVHHPDRADAKTDERKLGD